MMSTDTQIYTGAGYQEDSGLPAEQQGETPQGGQPGQQQPAQQPGAAPTATPAAPGTAQPTPTPTEGEQAKGDPLAALIQNRRDNRNETADLRQQVGELQTSISKLSPQTQAKAADWANPHNPIEEPMDHLRAEIDHLGGVVQQAVHDNTDRWTQQEQRQALNDFEQGVTVEIASVAQQVPELGQAHNAVVQHFLNTARIQGHSGAQLGAVARNAMLQAYLSHAAVGKDAVTATAEMAQALGFRSQPVTSGQPADITQPMGGQPGGGQQLNGHQPNGQAQQIARGQLAAATSLGGATGNNGATSPPDMQSLTRMSRAELKANDGANLKWLKAMLRGEV